MYKQILPKHERCKHAWIGKRNIRATARIAQSTLLTVSGVDRICSFLMSDSLTSFFKPTAYVAATCQTLTFGLIEAAVSESPAEFALGLLALFAADDVLGFLSES